MTFAAVAGSTVELLAEQGVHHCRWPLNTAAGLGRT